MSKPIISIIIPTYHRPTELRIALGSVIAQDKLDLAQVIVVDNHPTKSAKPVVKEFKQNNISYVAESKPGHSRAKNAGLKASVGEYVIFLDDDAKLPQNWLKDAIKIVLKQKPLIAGGPIEPYFLHQPPKWHKPLYEYRGYGSKVKFLTRDQFLPTSSTLIQTSALRGIGGFNPEYGIAAHHRRFGEDTDVLRRLIENYSTRIFYSPKLAVQHLTPPYKTTLRYVFSRHFQLGASGPAVSGDRVGAFKIFIKAILSLFGILIGFLQACFIRPEAYQYPQNYLWEIVAPKTYWLGRLYFTMGVR